jgi:hypothetical protein
MKIKTLILFLFILIGANRSRSAEARPKTADKADTLGVKIATIQYKLKAAKADSGLFEDGIMPWISLEKPDKQVDSLIDADEIVLPFEKATLIIDYPLKNAVAFDIVSSTKSFTRKELILLISEKYHQVYKEEEKTTNTVVVPIDKREGIINRNPTDGKYGICCHDLGDLDLSSIEAFKNPDGKISLILEIES